jgi:hypothetical protein
VARRLDLHAEPPPLPRRLTDPIPVVVVGSLIWLALAVALGVLVVTGVRAPDLWFTTAVAGVVVGAFGASVLGLQRRAARRGVKWAQKL